MPSSVVTLEICVDSLVGLEAAVVGGADRIELCSALALGGLTPSPGLISNAASVPLPVYAMVRPRAGDFVFSATEIRQMHQEVAAIRDAGLAGVVLGASQADQSLDVNCLRDLTAIAGGLGTTLHRAFDLTPDPMRALESAIGLGFERVLTSGQKTTVSEGSELIRRLVDQAGDRISIMPGGGVTPANVSTLVKATGVAEIHCSATGKGRSLDERAVALGFSPSATLRTTDAETVRALRIALST